MKWRKSTLSVMFLLISAGAFAQQASHWADSVLKSLTADEKIAQLIMVRLSAIDSKTRIVKFYDSTVERDIKQYNIGGICLFQGGPVKQASFVNYFQSIAKTPILFAIDGENGVGMRLDSVPGLPRMMMLGALRDSNLVYRYGEWVAEQCKQLGIQVNFAPVADINNNPNNPVINDRSFGENKYRVASLTTQYMLGMKKKGVMGSAKHFPGHGDVEVDSHLALPVINKSRAQLDSLELYPFKKLFDAGIGSAMVAHLFIPSIDSNANRATSISRQNVTDLLKGEMQFKGLTFTDALEMKGVADAFPNGDAAVESLVAGNDMLCLPGEVALVIKKVKDAINSGRVSWDQIDQHVIKVLEAKYETGLSSWKPVATENLANRLNEKTDLFKKEIAQKAITLAKYNNPGSFPLPPDLTGKYAVIDIGKNKNSVFSSDMRRSFNTDVFAFDNTQPIEAVDSLLALMGDKYEKVIIAIHEIPRFPANNFNLSAATILLANKTFGRSGSTIVVFGNPYSAKNFCDADNVLICYDDDAITQEVVASMLRGEVSPEGQLPVSVCSSMPVGTSHSIKTSLHRPQQVRVTAQIKIDSIINDAIKQKATPGMALLVVKDGKIVYEKTYGQMSYDKNEKVSKESVYDLASITKICATTLSLMKLYDEQKIELNKTLGDYLPWVRGSDKQGLTIKDILLHQAGLKPFIPFYKEIADSTTKKPLPGYFSKLSDETYSIKIDDSIYMRGQWRDTMMSRILSSPLDKTKRYVYSDNDFILLGEVIKAVSGQSIDQYAYNNFYRPLGLRSIGFNPTNYVDKKTIAPTEDDPYFREKMIRGYVHDPGAAMFGGIAGHAGLFSNAYDVAVLMQLLMNKGVINEKRYIAASTIDLFTSYQSNISRRGLGFDKPEKDNATRKEPYPAINVSPSTFGHLGFTGTCTWADPENKIIIVLLTNRVHPTAKNLYGDLNVRGKVVEEVWK
jgi:beta-glucosidase-like glycosyl hydrolase/CubicO group peptidase (beta-lactamase class C family)